eukprot:scaffold379885_cov17-Prasinocladus_malaysianus.AAC.1
MDDTSVVSPVQRNWGVQAFVNIIDVSAAEFPVNDYELPWTSLKIQPLSDAMLKHIDNNLQTLAMNVASRILRAVA